jgi:hypothetical protein
MEYWGTSTHLPWLCTRTLRRSCRLIRIRDREKLSCAQCGAVETFDARRCFGPNRARQYRIMWACRFLPHMCVICILQGLSN